MKSHRIGVFGSILGLACLLASPARAEEPAPAAPAKAQRAQALFDRAMELMAEGGDDRACPMLEESLRIDPAMGTRYRLAECYEKTNKQGSAYRLYREVADEAKRAGMVDREIRARTRSEALAPRLAHLVVWVPPEVARTNGLEVTIDGAPLDRRAWVGETYVVEIGDHVLEATAPGRKPYRRIVPVRLAGEPVEVSVPALHDESETPLKPTEAAPKDEKANPARYAAIVLGVGGTGALAAGVGIAGMAAATGGMSTTARASVGAGIGLGGLGVVAAGVTWFVSVSRPPGSDASPAAMLTLLPRVSLDGGGLSLLGRF